MENQKGHNNKKTKTIILSICALLAVGIGVFLTYSYLNSISNEVQNTFTVGGGIFLNLDETAMSGQNGRQQIDNQMNIIEQFECAQDVVPTTTSADNTLRVTGNKYNLIPNHAYYKDPTIHITNTVPVYLFIKIKNEMGDWLEISNFSSDFMEINDLDQNLINDSDKYKYYYYSKADDCENNALNIQQNEKQIVIFTSFKTKSDFPNTVINNECISIKAAAIEKNNDINDIKIALYNLPKEFRGVTS